jgi:hypothetical protein
MTAEWAATDMVGAKVAHPNHAKTAARVATVLAEHAGMSFSNACGHGGRQAARRAFHHPANTPEGFLAGVCEQTAIRCREHDVVLIAQDTCTFDFSTHRATEGLGPIGECRYSRGFFVHAALAMNVDGEPLGLLSLQAWARDPADFGKRKDRRKRPTSEKESHKWVVGLQDAQRHLLHPKCAVVMGDRESDEFALFSVPRRAGIELLVRAAHPRKVEIPGPDEAQTTDLLSASAQAPIVAQMSVTVPRKPKMPERVACLCVRATRLHVQVPRNGVRVANAGPQELNVVSATEIEPPEGAEPIHWVLITTLPIDTPEQSCTIVAYYAKRWVIECLHKTLKSGIGVERFQIDQAHALMNAVAVAYFAAWRILALTYVARTDPERPAEALMQPIEIEVLQAAQKKPVRTVAEAVLAIAMLAGYVHYRSAPPPGPKRLAEGLRILQTMVITWIIARDYYNPNQD